MKSAERWSGAAPAKVNLRLRVLAREVSGFHQIETVFQALGLSDRIELEVRPAGEVQLELSGVPEGALGPAADNLVVRAAGAFQGALRDIGRDPQGVRIRLMKRIPHGAGLGGGSSDAACVLRGLNALAGGPFSGTDLILMGGELGADVPFFLSGCSRALAWGRGDRLLPLPTLPPRDVLVIVPKEPIATAWAYRVLSGDMDGRPIHDPAGPTCHLPPDDEGWNEVTSSAANDFETALFPLRPELPRIKRLLHEMGGRPALLSGSGSAIFAVFHDEGACAAAAAAVREGEPGSRILATHTLA